MTSRPDSANSSVPLTGGDGGSEDTVPAPGHAFEHPTDAGRGGQCRALGWALGINAMLLAVDVAGGIVFGSLALLADAAHMVSDVVGLGTALGAFVLAGRPVNRLHSFGFVRAEVLAAQGSALMLVAAAGWIVVEAVARLRSPVAVDGSGLAIVGGLGVVANLASAGLVHRVQGHSLNMHASFLHLATDAAGSAGALAAGLLILRWGWTRADTLVSLATAAVVAWAGWGLLRDATHVLMEGVPRGLDPDQVKTAVCAVGGVEDIHHVHLWNIASDVPAHRFGLIHVTLELEATPDPGSIVDPDSGSCGHSGR